MPLLSVVLITKNEALNVRACLESVAFADEIIVYDSGSTDDTVAICREYTQQVVVTDWPGDGPQKNRAMAQASGEWILCIDADERLSPTLVEEIKQVLQGTEYNAFDIPFLSHYCGKPIRYGDWRGEHHIRLFRRGKAAFTPAYVYGADGAHCRLEVEGRTGKLKGKILHYPFPNLERVLTKLNAYSSGSAAIRHHHGKRGGIGVALAHGIWAFIRGYCLRLGFLDGREGFLLAVSNAEGTYYRYLKLMYLSSPQEA